MRKVMRRSRMRVRMVMVMEKRIRRRVRANITMVVRMSRGRVMSNRIKQVI
jgi:hypothetical protein